MPRLARRRTLRSSAPPPHPRASVTWGSGEAPPGGGIRPLAMVRDAAWEALAHEGTRDPGEKKGALRGPSRESWGRRRAGSGSPHGGSPHSRPKRVPAAQPLPEAARTPRPAPPHRTWGLKSLQGPGRSPCPMSLPARSQARPPGCRPAFRSAKPGGLGRTQAPEPVARGSTSSRSARSSAAAAAAGPHNGSSWAVTHPALAGAGPQLPTRSCSRAPHTLLEAGARPYIPTNPQVHPLPPPSQAPFSETFPSP